MAKPEVKKRKKAQAFGWVRGGQRQGDKERGTGKRENQKEESRRGMYGDPCLVVGLWNHIDDGASTLRQRRRWARDMSPGLEFYRPAMFHWLSWVVIS